MSKLFNSTPYNIATKIRKRIITNTNYGIIPKEIIAEIFLFLNQDDMLDISPSFFYHFNFHNILNVNIQEEFTKNNIFIDYKIITMDPETIIKKYITFCSSEYSSVDVNYLKQIIKKSKLSYEKIGKIFNRLLHYSNQVTLEWYVFDFNINFLKLLIELKTVKKNYFKKILRKYPCSEYKKQTENLIFIKNPHNEDEYDSNDSDYYDYSDNSDNSD